MWLSQNNSNNNNNNSGPEIMMLIGNKVLPAGNKTFADEWNSFWIKS